MQAFFIILPVFAADETEEKKLVEKTVSFSETTIDEDMEDSVADLVKLYGVVQQQVSLISFAAERNAQRPDNFFNLYFYVYIPSSSVSRFNTAKISVSRGKESSPWIWDLKQIDRSNSVYKFAVMNVNGYNVNYDGKETISFYIHSFSLNGTSYPAVGFGLPRGQAEAGLSLSFDVDQSEATLKTSSDDGQMKKYTMKAPKALKDDTLTLNTTLVSERVTTKDPDKYLQINTALITIPNEYFESYGNLSEVEYKYSLWDKVPMVVTDSEAFMKTLMNTDKRYMTEWSVPTHVSDAPIFIPSGASYSNTLPFSPYFCYYVSSIGTEKGSDYDVSSEKILNSLTEYSKLYNTVLKSLYNSAEGEIYKKVTPDSAALDRLVFLAALVTYGGDDFMYTLWEGHKEDVRTSVKAVDVIESESYASANSWWDKFWDGKLFRLNVDDSVSLPGISVFDNADKSKTDEELSKKYCIDVNEVPKLRNLTSLSESHKICFVRYLTTEYNVYGSVSTLNQGIGIVDSASPSGDSKYEIGSGYYCENAIIEDFKILRLFFDETDYTLGRVNRTTILVDDTEQDYAGGTESGDKLDKENTDITAFLPWNWGKTDDKFSLIRMAIRIVVIALVVFILLRLVLRLIPSIRKATKRSTSESSSPGKLKKQQSVNVRISVDDEKR